MRGQDKIHNNEATGHSSPKMINLALQGGGAHGAFTWGVLDCLLESEKDPLRHMLAELVNFDRVRSCDRMEFFISATSVRTGKVKVFNR